MSAKLESEILSRLDLLIKLTAASLGQARPLREAIVLLARCGLDRRAVAQILGTTPMTVSVRLSEAKRKPALRPAPSVPKENPHAQ